MITKIDEIRNALDAELYNCALALTLTLPDICAKIEYQNQINWGKGQKYRAWFDNFAKDKFMYESVSIPNNKTVSICTVDGKICWSLRCSVLHAGNYKQKNNTKITFHAHRPSSFFIEHECISDGLLELDIKKFCCNICDAAEDYYKSIVDKSLFEIDEVNILTW